MLTYSGNNQNIKSSVEIANNMLLDDAFYMKIKLNHTFDMSNATGIDMCRIIKKHRDMTITIESVKPKWRYSKMMAVFFPARPRVIGYNIYKNNSVESFVGMWIHELIHVYDALEPSFSFGHGTGRTANNPKGKENTAPYYIGRAAKQFCIDNHFRTPKPITRRRKWYNPFTWF